MMETPWKANKNIFYFLTEILGYLRRVTILQTTVAIVLPYLHTSAIKYDFTKKGG